ncbi:group I intron-associated PD-(D/E)XK endonuclease [Aliagarivorans taiwanensis]|uniref:group I intron-associated PD-(D/E)XK endonuclease n=1 Tax=Aliagarivorans taiwanensis TaxID=561966 RepID=UPI0004788FD3|nr:group I intron-associated PD-(D/E)XK endonuclease [Aliagarivorans taiwanensis]
MPKRSIVRTPPADKYYQNVSFETLTASWLTCDGWEVFMPITDHDMKTDLIALDGRTLYRIQVKAIDTHDESVLVENRWGSADIDYVIFFSKVGNWGYITKPFDEARKPLNSIGHIRFHKDRKPFIKAFESI